MRPVTFLWTLLRSLFQIGKYMFLKLAEVLKALKVPVDNRRADFGVFMNKNISQACHWLDTRGKGCRYYAAPAYYLNSFLIIFRPRPVVFGNNMVANVKYTLDTDFQASLSDFTRFDIRCKLS